MPRTPKFRWCLILATLLLTTILPAWQVSARSRDAARSASPMAEFNKDRVTFKSGNLTLIGYLYKPDGKGPFPALIWNHGSEQSPGTGEEFDSIASVFVPQGYVVFAPIRRGHGDSQGKYIVDVTAQAAQEKGAQFAKQLVVNLLAGEQLDDQLAGLDYLKKLAYVDTSRIGVIGCSYGGIETIFGAESKAGYKVAVAMSPGAESWEGNEILRQRLIDAVDHIKIPVLFMHPSQDASIEPGFVLAREFAKTHIKVGFGLIIYPPLGTEAQQGHCFGGPAAHWEKIWGDDAKRFLNTHLK